MVFIVGCSAWNKGARKPVGPNKLCPKCKLDKPLGEFRPSVGRRDGVQVYCRPCQRFKDNDHYRQSQERRTMLRVRQKERLARNRAFVRAHMAAHPCVDCGEDDLDVLDLDHVRGKKLFEIADGLHAGYSLERIKLEIEKCEVRCANCHRRQTRQRERQRRTFS